MLCRDISITSRASAEHSRSVPDTRFFLAMVKNRRTIFETTELEEIGWHCLTIP